MRLRRRASSWLILAATVAIGCAVMATGADGAMERTLMTLRSGIVDRAASGRVVIVEMDAASAAAIKRWPWSRSNYAQVVDRLRRAGAASIVFDVDFSSVSDAPGDRAFAGALARADGLVALPTFGQQAGSNDRRTFDALPIPLLRPHVALASVSIAPDADGQVRTMPLGTVTQGVPRPSLSAFIAARSGTADRDFPIDMAIDPRSIPRLSFVAVRDGRFDAAAVRGRNVLIGATAVEMGDRYATPAWGVIPGVVIQALAAETLLHGMPVGGWAPTMLLVAALAAAALVSRRSAAAIAATAAAAALAIAAGVLLAQHRLLLIYPLAAPLLMVAVATAASLARAILGRFRAQRVVDEATGLPNARALLQPCRSAQEVAVAAAQIDNYDTLCAVLGHRAVADVIIRIGERLALLGEDGTIYRSGDHQLAFLLSPEQAVDDTLQGLRMLLLQPVEVGGRRIDVSVSVGVALGRRDAVERLLTEATLAADEARTSGVFWCRATTDVSELERSISLMGELDDAIAGGQIEVYYQPKLDLRERRIVSVEALVRWRHPRLGFVGPNLFVPVAEKTNRIAPLTLHVLAQVARDTALLRRAHPDLTAAVNISAKLLSAPAFNADVEGILAEAAAPASAFVFEVTESAAMSDTDAAIAALRRYRDLGIAVSMDDYGTGQSTLTYLRQLPLSELKIDRSFVQFAHQNHDDAVLVRSTVALAHDLGIKVVAEGVEDAACLRFLEECGCDSAQGYLISKPVPLAALQALLAAERLAA